jgi:hypothetical protein
VYKKERRLDDDAALIALQFCIDASNNAAQQQTNIDGDVNNEENEKNILFIVDTKKELEYELMNLKCENVINKFNKALTNTIGPSLTIQNYLLQIASDQQLLLKTIFEITLEICWDLQLNSLKSSLDEFEYATYISAMNISKLNPVFSVQNFLQIVTKTIDDLSLYCDFNNNNSIAATTATKITSDDPSKTITKQQQQYNNNNNNESSNDIDITTTTTTATTMLKSLKKNNTFSNSAIEALRYNMIGKMLSDVENLNYSVYNNNNNTSTNNAENNNESNKPSTMDNINNNNNNNRNANNNIADHKKNASKFSNNNDEFWGFNLNTNLSPSSAETRRREDIFLSFSIAILILTCSDINSKFYDYYCYYYYYYISYYY